MINNKLEPNNTTKIEYLLPRKTCDKKTLVLDLDETLVHSQFQPFDVPSDITLKIELEDELHDIHILVRPGVKEFLQNMGKIYEIVIFTASVSKYADPLLDIIDREKNCKFRLFREHCTPINTCYVKEIKKLGRELKDVVIVDNSPMSYALNPENGLPILTWFDDKEDRELYNISSILEFLSFVPDVRSYISQFVVNDEISYNNVIDVFDSYNEMLTQKKNPKENTIKNKSKDSKTTIIKKNSKAKFNQTNYNNNNNIHYISDNKENISNNVIISSNNNENINKFKKNKTFSNLNQKCDGFDVKMTLNCSKNQRPNSKKSVKVKVTNNNNFNPKSIIANINKNENSENINPNIINVNDLNKLNNILTDTPNFNQTTKNKDNKNIKFNPNSIIASVIPSSTQNKNSFSTYNNRNLFSNNIKAKQNSKIIKHRKSDSSSGLFIPKNGYENKTTHVSKRNQSHHANSIILNKTKKINSPKITNDYSNYIKEAQTAKDKSKKDFQLSMRISRDIGKDLEKFVDNVKQSQKKEKNDEKSSKKLSKSLNREKISVSFSLQYQKSNSSINTNYAKAYANDTFCNKSSLIKYSKAKENPEYAYHKKNKSINSQFRKRK